jgi:ATP/maltotriose-dependent transcriptional regulator MalT
VLEHPEGLTPRERLILATSIVANGYFGGEPVETTLARIPRSMDALADSLVGEAVLLRIRGALLGMLGQLEESIADLERGERTLEDVAAFRGIMSSQIAGEAALRRGDFTTAERLFRGAHEHFNATGETGFNSTVAALLAIALLELGRVDEAIEMTARSRAMTNEEDFASEALWRMAQALIDSWQGEHDAAESLAREAIRLTGVTDYVSMDGDAHETLARVLAAAGRVDEARDELGAARERYERKGDLASIARIDGRLATL